MKKEYLILAFLFTSWFGNVMAQDYSISFAGSGASTLVSSVKIENLTRGTTLTMNGGDMLHLVSSTTGIEHLSEKEIRQISFFPNPMTEYTQMQFDLEESGNAVIELFDITGRRVLFVREFLTRGRHTYRLEGISKGMYFARVKSNKYLLSGSLVCSNSQSSSAKIEYKNSAFVNNTNEVPFINKDKLFFSKGENTEIEMKYTTGDRLKLTAFSGNYSTVITDVFSGSKTITFNFTACTDGDANNYPIVQIGSQTWMAENLKTTKYRDGLVVGNVTDNSAWSDCKTGAYCWLNNNTEVNKNIFGGMYNWLAVSTRRLCPTGWHVPSDVEWTTLTTFLGGTLSAGGKLKETGTIHWESPNAGATNETGFTSLPGGYRPGDFQNAGRVGYWWSATETSSSTAWMRWMEYYGPYVGRMEAVKTNGNYVRCLKDNVIPPAGDYTINTDFGTLVFTVGSSGSTITTMAYTFVSWKCGPVTVSGGMTISQTPPWPVTNGYFSIANRLDTYGNQTITISGTYNSSNSKFSGTWTENSYGTICTGTWEATKI